jgi:hypothetical protein
MVDFKHEFQIQPPQRRGNVWGRYLYFWWKRFLKQFLVE